jgi:hypothetical protein
MLEEDNHQDATPNGNESITSTPKEEVGIHQKCETKFPNYNELEEAKVEDSPSKNIHLRPPFDPFSDSHLLKVNKSPATVFSPDKKTHSHTSSLNTSLDKRRDRSTRKKAAQGLSMS